MAFFFWQRRAFWLNWEWQGDEKNLRRSIHWFNGLKVDQDCRGPLHSPGMALFGSLEEKWKKLLDFSFLAHFYSVCLWGGPHGWRIWPRRTVPSTSHEHVVSQRPNIPTRSSEVQTCHLYIFVDWEQDLTFVELFQRVGTDCNCSPHENGDCLIWFLSL